MQLFLLFELFASNSELLPAKFSVIERDCTSVLAIRMTPSPQGALHRQYRLRWTLLLSGTEIRTTQSQAVGDEEEKFVQHLLWDKAAWQLTSSSRLFQSVSCNGTRSPSTLAVCDAGDSIHLSPPNHSPFAVLNEGNGCPTPPIRRECYPHRETSASFFSLSWHSPVAGPQEDVGAFTVFLQKVCQLHPPFTNKGGSEKPKESQRKL